MSEHVCVCVFINVHIACVYVCVLNVCGEGERADFIGSCLQHNSEEGGLQCC